MFGRRDRKAGSLDAARALLAGELRFATDSGQIMLFDQRMLLMHAFSLAELRKEMIERLGHEMARGILTRLGYQQGLEDYKRIRATFGDDVSTTAQLGLLLRAMQGFVHVTPREIRDDPEPTELFGHYYWDHSWEAEAHLKQFGVSSVPACWMNVGCATAFGTSVFGYPLLAREIECVAMGHPRCHVVIKPLNEWDEVGDDLQFMRVEDFVDPPIKRHSKGAGSDAILPLEAPPPISGELVGASAGFNGVAYLLKRVAKTDTSVMFLGESGVGKERFSRALHQISGRASGPFVSVNCAAIPNELVEAELFGVEKGAFTGATSSRPGRFERANGGTLFLDEIGSLPFHAQGKLLRAVQEREIERVGGTELIKVDVRIAAATNEDLKKAVEGGRFRADLFYRLHVFPIQIPPLRDRTEDIPLLFGVFLERFAKRFNKAVSGITKRAHDMMWHYAWPGNVRELENMVERAVILADDGGVIDANHLFCGVEGMDTGSFGISADGSLLPIRHEVNAAGTRGLVDDLLAQGKTLPEIEAAMIEAALDQQKGKIAAAARQLGLGRGQLQYRVKKLRAGTRRD